MQAAIEVHDLTVAYRHKPVLWGADFTLNEGSLVSIVGPNGAGKSTLLKAMLGLVPVSSGWVKIYGEPIRSRRSLVAYVPQREEVDWDFPVSVREVVSMGRSVQIPFYKRLKREDFKYIENALEQVGMTEYADRQIGQLSGGQQQRVFIARALAQDARVYLLDEPFSGIDAATEQALIEVFRRLREQEKLVVCVHHDLNTVAEYFDHAILLNMRIVAVGDVKDVFTQENLLGTYGGRLGLLSDVAEHLRKSEWKKRS